MGSARLGTILLALAVVSTGLAGCAEPGSRPADNQTDGTEDPPPPRQGIAWDRVPSPDEIPEPDGPRLRELVERQVYVNDTEPRYRIPGTQAHRDTVPVLVGMLEETGAEVTTESLRVELPCLGTVNATNVYGERAGDPEREIWIAAHWDSRAWADHAIDEDNSDEPVLGANDGAAAVAVATHALAILPDTEATVKVALFDAEDQGSSGEARMPCQPSSSSTERRGGWIQGSTHAAEARNETQIDRIEALILVDMPGHEELSIRRESSSERHAPNLTDLAFGAAERLQAPSFHNASGGPVLDDHVPFLERGVPALDLIHLDQNGTSSFPWTWHTPHDTPEHLSEAAMAEVTRVTVATALAVDRGALPDGRIR